MSGKSIYNWYDAQNVVKTIAELESRWYYTSEECYDVCLQTANTTLYSGESMGIRWKVVEYENMFDVTINLPENEKLEFTREIGERGEINVILHEYIKTEIYNAHRAAKIAVHGA